MSEMTIADAFQLAVAHHQAGRLAEAVPIYRQILQALPREAEIAFDVLNNLGAALDDQQQWREARACFADALARRPDSFLAANNLAHTLRRESRFEEAIEAYRRATALDDANAGAHFNLGVCLERCGRFDEALVEFRRVTELVPNRAEAFANLGYVWSQLRNLEQSISASRQALALQPELAAAHCNLGLAQQSLGQLDLAIDSFRTAARLAPAEAAWQSNLLYALNYHPASGAAAIRDEHRAWAARHADPLTIAARPHGNSSDPERRLRVGYVSPFFRAHAVNNFVEPILAAHDRGQCDVFAYSDVPPAQRDATTDRMRGYVHHWQATVHLTDAALSDLVRRDQIDILVDLSGHIGGNRLLAFARRPAPVQVTYIGYQNTTGMAGMDYRLTDDWSDPPDTTDRYYSEKLVRLPRTFFCYLPDAEAPAVGPLRALERGCVTFGSFNNFAKVTPQVLETWATVLAGVPGSRLVLLVPTSAELAARVRAEFARHGIESERIEIASRRPQLDYLRLIDQTDIALDAFPMNGHTTTCDCLWQGVPVVMLAGDTYVSRYGGSALVNLGLQDWIAHDPSEYVETARRWATDLPRLADLRAGLRARMAASPILDAAGFTRHLEAAYRRMWQAWCSQPG